MSRSPSRSRSATEIQLDPKSALVDPQSILGVNPPRPSFDESPDLLPLLADERDDVRKPIGVERGHDCVDWSRESLQHVLVEFPIACIFQPAGFTIVVAEARDRQVEVPVTVEVACPHVGHSSRLVEDHMRGEILTTIVFKQC